MRSISTKFKTKIPKSRHDTDSPFTMADQAAMAMAIAEASAALIQGDLPVGAALAVNGSVIGTARNSNNSDKCWSSHAEHKLILQHSKLITEVIKNHSSRVELFSTIEPCMMCFGTAIFHHISRVVFALSDTETGFTLINFGPLSPWYQKAWPDIESGLLERDSAELIERYRMKSP
jgi:tRNA(adenine34) deaminase